MPPKRQKLYVGNLPYLTSERELRELFLPYAPVSSVVLISDKDTGNPRGYGFVELEEPKVQSALCGLNNVKLGGRRIRVSRALGKIVDDGKNQNKNNNMGTEPPP